MVALAFQCVLILLELNLSTLCDYTVGEDNEKKHKCAHHLSRVSALINCRYQLSSTIKTTLFEEDAELRVSWLAGAARVGCLQLNSGS